MDFAVLHGAITNDSLVVAFLFMGGLTFFSWGISSLFPKNVVHGSSVALLLALVLAYCGGLYAQGKHGLADIPLFAGISVLGGTTFRDLAIVASAYGIQFEEVRRTGLAGFIALCIGISLPFWVGCLLALAFGYTDPKDICVIASGAVTMIVAAVTGSSLGVSSEIIALGMATGVAKAMLVMISAPFVARFVHLDNPQTAIVFGGLMGVTSGVVAGLTAVDARLVPYGALGATFYTGLGCLFCPSLFYLLIVHVM